MHTDSSVRSAAPAESRSLFDLLNFMSLGHRNAHKLAQLHFTLFILVQLGLLLGFIRWAFPYTWEQHVQAGPVAIIVTTAVCSMVLCIGEHLFHRYMLHLDVVRFLGSLCSSHRTHHKLTSVKFDRQGIVHSEYAITTMAQDDQATFPSWALIPFFTFFTPFFAVIAFSFPHIPILIGGYTAIAIEHYLFEMIHVLHHLPYETYWKPRMHGRLTSPIWSWLYGFHLAHHVNYKCNMNVAGFYGLPLADLLFGTYVTPRPIPVEGVQATSAMARGFTPQPYFFIAWLDRVAFKRKRWMVKEG